MYVLLYFLDNDEDSVATSGDADKVDRVVKSIMVQNNSVGESASTSQGVYMCV